MGQIEVVGGIPLTDYIIRRFESCLPPQREVPGPDGKGADDNIEKVLTTHRKDSTIPSRTRVNRIFARMVGSTCSYQDKIISRSITLFPTFIAC